MARFVDPLYTNTLIDANIFDEIAHGKNEAVAEIVRIYDEGEINVLLAYSVQEELNDPSTPESVKRAARSKKR